MDKETVIVCPQCGARINVSQVLYHQLNDQIQKEFEARQSEQEEEFQERLKEVEVSRRAVEQERERLNEAVQIGVREKLAAERSRLEKAIRENVENEKSGEIKTMREELLSNLGASSILLFPYHVCPTAVRPSQELYPQGRIDQISFRTHLS